MLAVTEQKPLPPRDSSLNHLVWSGDTQMTCLLTTYSREEDSYTVSSLVLGVLKGSENSLIKSTAELKAFRVIICTITYVCLFKLLSGTFGKVYYYSTHCDTVQIWSW